MATFSHPEWLARNALRAYPLNEQSPRISSRGFALPDDLLVDLLILSTCAATSGTPGAFYLQSVCLTPALVSCVFGEVASGRSLATACAPAGAAAGTGAGALQTVELAGLAGTAAAGGALAGSVVFGPALGAGRYEELLAAGQGGSHVFSATNVFEARCSLRAGPFPLRSLNGLASDVDVRLTGSLRGSVSTLAGSSGQPSTTLVTLSLADPAKFVSPCFESARTPCGAAHPPIRSINGVRGNPAAGGQITVRFLGFSSQRTVDNTLRVLQLQTGRDLCAKQPLPDDNGRLPLDYTADVDPVSSY